MLFHYTICDERLYAFEKWTNANLLFNIDIMKCIRVEIRLIRGLRNESD